MPTGDLLPGRAVGHRSASRSHRHMGIGAAEAAELMERHGVSPRKALGQNFVIDPNTIDRIVRLAEIGPDDRVVEIGPGIGSLTGALGEAAGQVLAVEVDGDLVPVLHETLADQVASGKIQIVHDDATTLAWRELLGATPGWKLVANLPYNVGTPLVLDVLDHVPEVTEILVMVQREVAERFAAAPDTAEYGIPSVKVSYWGSAEVVGRVPATVFVPRPNVESALVRITRAAAPAVDADREILFELVRRGFGQRRKMLRRSLSPVVGPDEFDAAGIDGSTRPGELGVQGWGRLAAAVTATED